MKEFGIKRLQILLKEAIEEADKAEKALDAAYERVSSIHEVIHSKRMKLFERGIVA